MHSDKSSINFGKQLIDTFKPQSILLEDGPLQVPKDLEFTCPDTGFTHPATYDLTHELAGKVADEFIRRSIEDNSDAYRMDSREGIVHKRYEDGIEEPFDMGTYALHHMDRLR